MTPQERFLAYMRFDTVDRPPLFEWGGWSATVERWVRESGLTEREALYYLDECDAQASTGVDFAMRPPIPERVLAEDDDTVTKVDGMGQVSREFKAHPDNSMPEFVGFPVSSADDWAEIKRRLDPSLPERYPADWELQVAQWQREQPILKLYGFVAGYYGGPSLFGFVRMLLGPERALYAFYDEPDLVHDMMEHATDFAIAVMEKALREAPVTYVQFWEDMCYKGGPLIAPATMREFMLPRYRRMTEAIRRAGVEVIFVDSDGDVSELIPLWLEAGINGVFPMEQAAGNDIRTYQRQYGHDLLIMGGIDKRALAAGREAIERELQAKLPLAEGGGYIPTLDHAVPPDVAFDDFYYYWQRKKELLGV
ncbi:MAG TPA: uroporphyrinogen decarboxylase family protein [Armatimonadota bacterium]|jgi:uroporphyrinogen decarboxylase